MKGSDCCLTYFVNRLFKNLKERFSFCFKERSIMELFNFMNVMQEIMFTIAVIGVAWLIPDLSNLKDRKNG